MSIVDFIQWSRKKSGLTNGDVLLGVRLTHLFIGGILGAVISNAVINSEKKEEFRESQRYSAFEKYSQDYCASTNEARLKVDHYFYDGQKLVISGENPANRDLISLVVKPDGSEKLHTLAGIVMNTSKIHVASFPAGNSIEMNYEAYTRWLERNNAGLPYTNICPVDSSQGRYVPGKIREVVKSALDVKIN